MIFRQRDKGIKDKNMKQRLADYIADFLTEHGVTDCFTVTGGGAMHLNDAFGHHPGLHCTYNHHEQASAIAAEAYARLTNRMALLCVTTGPGGTNALTGVLGGWLDSIPMFVVSGQVRYDTTARYNARFTGEALRAVGDQEFDITKAAGAMCKYAVMVEDPKMIRYHLERAWYLAVKGRPGPVWIDVPVNFQGAVIETDELVGYDRKLDETILPPRVSVELVKDVLDQIRKAKRPVIYAGNGIRLSGGIGEFRRAVDLLGVPVCTYWDSIDLIETDHPLYVGRGGNMGDRAGNFAVQNADLVLAVGNRLPIRVTGYNWKTWARAAKVIMVDIDPGEMKKPTIHVEQAIHADAKDFLTQMVAILEKETKKGSGDPSVWFTSGIDVDYNWVKVCRDWKADYPVVTQEQMDQDVPANPYAVFDMISRALPAGITTITSNGTCCVAGHQTWVIKEGSRFLNNNAVASMGYGLPAAIGAAVAERKETKDPGHPYVVCLEGDGSIMMNLQELQTISTNKLPVKIFLINNEGYHSIRQTQGNLFAEHSKVGIGPESGDLSFPDFQKLADAFSLAYVRIEGNREMEERIGSLLEEEGPMLCEILVTTEQRFEPKSSTRRNPDGTLESPPLEDLAPFLPREELKRNMYI